MQTDGRKTVRFVLFCCLCKEAEYGVCYLFRLLCIENTVVTRNVFQPAITDLIHKIVLFCLGLFYLSFYLFPFCSCGSFRIDVKRLAFCLVVCFHAFK